MPIDRHAQAHAARAASHQASAAASGRLAPLPGPVPKGATGIFTWDPNPGAYHGWHPVRNITGYHPEIGPGAYFDFFHGLYLGTGYTIT